MHKFSINKVIIDCKDSSDSLIQPQYCYIYLLMTHVSTFLQQDSFLPQRNCPTTDYRSTKESNQGVN